jgi:RND family efflux transporter, MFP subunit
MKNSLYPSTIIVLLSAIILSACSSSSVDKSTQLEKLKAEQVELNKKISLLEKEIQKENPEAITIKSKEVAVTTISPRKFDHYIQTQGMVEAEDNILVSAKSMGVVTQVYAQEGEQVSKGQTLAQIDNTVMVRSIDEVKSGLELAKTVFDRQKNLWDQKIGTEVQYLQAKNNKESLENRLATLNEQLEMTKIKSPINGVVEAVNIKIGENAAPGFPAFRVINTSDLKINAKISESFITTIKKGDRVSISFPDLDKKIESKVSFVGRNIEALSRSFPLEIDLPASSELRPNMTAVIRVVFNTEAAALCVPVNAVQEINGEKVVYVAVTEGDKTVARKRVVEVVGVYDNLAQVKSGIQSGDRVITVGFQGLNDGDFVKI